MSTLTKLADEAYLSIDALGARASGLFEPTIRLGVTGLSRAGKTVFITALIHNLVHGGTLPLFQAHRGGRISSAQIAHQKRHTVPRFQYEDHIRTIVRDRLWPESTRSVSEFRLTITFESASSLSRTFGPGKLSVDIIDYPGEWLLDLPLLEKDYETFSAESFAAAKEMPRAAHANEWMKIIRKIDPSAPFREEDAEAAHKAFVAYLAACKADPAALSSLPPGRFLMPGDLDGSPALTFFPLPPSEGQSFAKGSFRRTMAERYEAYKHEVIRPFFLDHVARLDRQIVLVDAMQALNSGPGSVQDLETALSEILSCFRPGGRHLLSALFPRRLDKILIAATKADQLHSTDHDAYAAIIRRLADKAIKRAQFSGAHVDVMAMAAIRATKEGRVSQNGEEWPVIIGTPQKGEIINDGTFDGETETAIFPGDLPADPESIFEQTADDAPIRFVRFRPPAVSKKTRANGEIDIALPHIRLDQALEFLLGDHLR